MRVIRLGAILLLIGLTGVGCYRTHYINLYPASYAPPEPPSGRSESTSNWRNFWIYGWVPGEMEIDTIDVCGEGHVREIETQLTFLQGLVTALASIYINIYAPWTGKISCYRGAR